MQYALLVINRDVEIMSREARFRWQALIQAEFHSDDRFCLRENWGPKD